MGRLSPITEAEVVQLHGARGPALDEIGLAAWIAQAEPGEALVYHRGFLAVDATSVISKLPADRQRTLQLVAAAARRAAEQNLVHLVQSRLGPDAFAYIAVARPKPGPSGAALSVRLLEAA